jgi:hypothetical protein
MRIIIGIEGFWRISFECESFVKAAEVPLNGEKMSGTHWGGIVKREE